VTEVLGHETRVAAFLAQPGRCSVAQCVGGDVLLDPGARSGSPDDVGEDRLLQRPPLSPQNTGSVGVGCLSSRNLRSSREESLREIGGINRAVRSTSFWWRIA
jgi:hypothetical protein